MVEKWPCPAMFLLVIATTALVSCAAPSSSPLPKTVANANEKDETKRAENDWIRCLNRSYAVTRTETASKDAAAEMALRNCSAEERLLVSITDMVTDPMTSNEIIAHLRAAAKQVLLEKGEAKLVN